MAKRIARKRLKIYVIVQEIVSCNVIFFQKLNLGISQAATQKCNTMCYLLDRFQLHICVQDHLNKCTFSSDCNLLSCLYTSAQGQMINREDFLTTGSSEHKHFSCDNCSLAICEPQADSLEVLFRCISFRVALPGCAAVPRSRKRADVSYISI